MNDRHDLGLSDRDAGCNCGTHSHHDEGSSQQQASNAATATTDLKPGGSSTVSVASSSPIDAEAVRAAVEEAGYSLAGASR
jgi:copper chaperone